MKMKFALILMLVSCSVMAKGSSHVKSNEAISNDRGTSIITPDVATDGLRTERYSRTTAGDTVFCPAGATYSWRDVTCVVNGVNAWVYAHQLVPIGKTYVGFRIYSNGYEIYWR